MEVINTDIAANVTVANITDHKTLIAAVSIRTLTESDLNSPELISVNSTAVNETYKTSRLVWLTLM